MCAVQVYFSSSSQDNTPIIWHFRHTIVYLMSISVIVLEISIIFMTTNVLCSSHHKLIYWSWLFITTLYQLIHCSLHWILILPNINFISFKIHQYHHYHVVHHYPYFSYSRLTSSIIIIPIPNFTQPLFHCSNIINIIPH